MMTDMRFALAIPHCPWDPHRARNLAVLKDQLHIHGNEECEESKVAVFASIGPTPNWIWSGKLFEWLAAQDTEWSVQLQDDVHLVPEFWGVLKAALSTASAAGCEAASMFTIFPHAQQFSGMGCNWMSTTDWMVGPCWAVKTSFMREFVKFRRERLREGWDDPDPATGRLRSGLNEDTLLGLGCAAYGKRIWHPLPALVDHDTAIPSQYGNAGQRFNRASFNWLAWAQGTGKSLAELQQPAFWVPRNPVQGPANTVVHLGCAYSFTAINFMRWCIDDGQPYGGLPWGKRVDQIRTDVVNVEAVR